MPAHTVVSAVTAYRHLISHLLQVNAPHQIHLATVNLEDVKPRALVRVWELDFAVNPAGPQQSSIQDIYPVGGHEDLQPEK